jgi:AAA+ superfamily predicted ATPase
LLAQAEQDSGSVRIVPSDENEGPSAPLSVEPRWAHVSATFALSAVEQDLLLIALASELDLRYETLFAYLNDDVTRKWPTADLATRLLTPRSELRDVLQALAPTSRLRANRLIEAIAPPTGRPSQLNGGFALTPSVARFLQGLRLTPVTGNDDTDREADDWAALALSTRDLEALGRVAKLIARGDGQPRPVVLLGSPGAGRWHAARALARELRLPIRSVDLRAIRRAGMPLADVVSDVALDMRLEPAVVCVHGLSALAEADQISPETTGTLAELTSLRAPLVILATPLSPWSELLGGARALVLELGQRDYDEQLHLWSEYLRRSGLALPEDERRLLADCFRFTPAQVRDAVATAYDWQTMGGDSAAADLSLVREAARAQSRVHLGSLATLAPSPFGWDDLVLPPATVARLRELVAAIRLRHVVYGEWGFARRLHGTLGIKALFGGPSGTGKTMAAGVIAREAGLDLVKVDLSGLVSKYIGETEKNLNRVFASARAGNALLFFDEADAIFGKRSEVRDAHDRYANIESAYLLQMLDTYDGGVILATNLRKNIDDAFARRLHYTIDFPHPNAPLRERLWRGMFPAEAPLADDLDIEFLARQFDLCGGDIRNVVLDAAFLAAADGRRIAMPHVVNALARQLSKQGKTATSPEFQQYFSLIEDHAHGEAQHPVRFDSPTACSSGSTD